MNRQIDNELGICAACGEIHKSEKGFMEDRKCTNCGEHRVFSIVEYRDIVNDWIHMKEEYEALLNDLDDYK